MGEFVKKLDHFMIGKAYGSNQEWMSDPWLRFGGCATITACDMCISLALNHKMCHLIPDTFDPRHITRLSYDQFAHEMKPYLRPRFNGVSRLDLFVDGFEKYLKDRHMDDRITISDCPGETDTLKAWEILCGQIDKQLPVPYLLLRHKDKSFHDFEWHWFLLNGYRISPDGKKEVLSVTYGEGIWLDFEKMWQTGYTRNGGMILYELTKDF